MKSQELFAKECEGTLLEIEEVIENQIFVEESEDEKEEKSPINDMGNIGAAFIVSSDWTLETIYSQIKKNNIDLDPKFQRRDVWSDVKKSRLIESILLRIPIPQLLLAEKKEKYNSYIVIDGKQRLLAIKQFMDGLDERNENPLKLKGLLVLEELNGKTAREVKALGIDDKIDYSNFENETIRSIFIRNWPSYEYLYTVFNRLNTGSSPLSAQELRLSLFPGKFSEFTNEQSSNNAILKLLGKTEPDKRMKDVELVIRFYAFKYFAKEYRGKLKAFFDTTVERLNKQWETQEDEIKKQFNNLLETIKFTQTYLGDLAFKRTKEGKITLVIFDVFSFFLSDEDTRLKLESIDKPSEKIQDRYKRLMLNPEFIEITESHTSDLLPTKKRFEMVGNLLNELFESEGIDYRITDFGVQTYD